MTSVLIQDVQQQSDFANDARFDLAIGFAGVDQRSTHLLKKVKAFANRMVVFVDAKRLQGLPTGAEESDRRHESADGRRAQALLRQVGPHDLRAWAGEEMDPSLSELLRSSSPSAEAIPHVFVDVSAFPRSLLAIVLNALRSLVLDLDQELRITLGYCPAAYSDPIKGPLPANNRVAPVHRSLAGWSTDPTLPVELIVGLGYEKGKALGAVEYIQPSHWRLFVPNSDEGRFLKQVIKQNAELIENTDVDARFDYDVLDPSGQLSMMSSMLGEITKYTRPVLLPFGPKIFFAVCIMVAMRYPDVAVWHVSGEDAIPTSGRKPSGKAVTLSLTLRRSKPPSSTE